MVQLACESDTNKTDGNPSNRSTDKKTNSPSRNVTRAQNVSLHVDLLLSQPNPINRQFGRVQCSFDL